MTVLTRRPQTFKLRALSIADKAQNTRAVQQGSDGNDFAAGLDETERACECRVAAHNLLQARRVFPS